MSWSRRISVDVVSAHWRSQRCCRVSARLARSPDCRYHPVVISHFSCEVASCRLKLQSDCTIVAIVSIVPLRSEVKHVDFLISMRAFTLRTRSDTIDTIATIAQCECDRSDRITMIARPYLWDPAKSKRARLWAPVTSELWTHLNLPVKWQLSWSNQYD